MFQQVIQDNLQKTLNFAGYILSFIKRMDPLRMVVEYVMTTLKDFLTMSKKLKMAKYRVNYQMYKLQQMEQLIAENNDHVFLKGKKLNQTR